MKTKKIIVAIVMVLLVLSFFSCESVGSVLEQLAPGIAQAASLGLQELGVPPHIADSLGKSGVNVAAVMTRNRFEENLYPLNVRVKIFSLLRMPYPYRRSSFIIGVFAYNS